MNVVPFLTTTCPGGLADSTASTIDIGSVTVTLNVAVLALPAASVAVAVTVVTPGGNNEPGGGLYVMTGDAVPASLADACP